MTARDIIDNCGISNNDNDETIWNKRACNTAVVDVAVALGSEGR